MRIDEFNRFNEMLKSISAKELRECPACGSRVVLELTMESDGNLHYYDWRIHCTNKECRIEATYPADKYYGRDSMTLQDVISRWNGSVHERKDKIWNNHEVACILAEVTGDDCACDIGDIGEWLTMCCDFAETTCPNPCGVACWEQFLKHYKEKDKWLN